MLLVALALAAAERRCPQRQFRAITAADLDFAQQRFENQLPPGPHRDLTAANHAEFKCKGHNALSCPVIETLDVYRRTKMLSAFATFVCVHSRR